MADKFYNQKPQQMTKENPQLPPLAERIKQTCQRFGIRLKPEIGQHLLVNEEVVRRMVEAIPPHRTVIEIGAGLGQVTEALALKSRRVVAIEIDRQFEGPLKELQSRFPNVSLVFDNALKLDFPRLADPQKESVELAGSLPYHITEPLMMRISPPKVQGATFLVGRQFAQQIKADKEDSPHFGKLTLLVNTFYHYQNLGLVDKNSFFPPPRTNSVLIRLTPREESEFLENKILFLLKELFASAPRGTLIKNVLREALIRFKERKASPRQKKKEPVMTKNEARAIIATLRLPETLLNKSVEQLNNQELAQLYQALCRFCKDSP